MGKIQITYDSKHCIGAGVCESLGKGLWSIGKDGKAILHGATEKDGVYTLVLDESERNKQECVASSCPAGCIKVSGA